MVAPSPEVRKAITFRSIIEEINRGNPHEPIQSGRPDPERKFDAVEKACQDGTLRSLRQIYQQAKFDLDSHLKAVEEKNGGSITINKDGDLPHAPKGKDYVRTHPNSREGTDTYVLMTPEEQERFNDLTKSEGASRGNLNRRNDDLMKEHKINTSPNEVLDKMEGPLPQEQKGQEASTESVLPLQVSAAARNSRTERMA